MLKYQIPCLLFAVAMMGCTKPSPPPSLPTTSTASSRSEPGQTQAQPETSANREARRKDLAAADLAAHLGVNWQAFTCSFDEPPTEFGVDLLVTEDGDVKTFPGPSFKNANGRVYEVAFLFQPIRDGAELRYTLRANAGNLGASQQGQMENPFVELQMVTVGAPIRLDDQGRTVIAYALQPGESKDTAAASHPDSAYRALVLQVTTINP